MKKFLLFAGLLLFVVVYAQSQTIVFHENFELPSLGDSMVSSQNAVPGTDDFGINTRVFQGANSQRSDSCQVKTGKTTYLTSATFSTVGNSYVLLNFWHICKVDQLDGGYIEVSNNGGTSWTQVLAANYVNNNTLLPPGVGSFGTNGNKFINASYGGTWAPAAPLTLPSNTWWRQETFDVSAMIGNCPNAKFRFRLPDGGTAGPGGNPANAANNKGWYFDNIVVKASFAETIPPYVAIVNPIWSGVTYSTGPYPVRVKASDLSGMDAVKLVYSTNGGINDTLPMVYQAADTSWYASLPVMADSSQVCYYAIAWDASPVHNFATTLTTSTCITLIYYYPFGFPFNDNFDGTYSLWEAGPASGTTKWEWGVPNNGVTNTVHSPAKCWDINLTTDYGTDAACVLMSPPLNFSGAFNARLSFWYNYKTQANNDGFRLEYSTNGGSTWSILGDGPNPAIDPLGINWYTDASLNFTTDPGWEGNSNGWKQAKYRLSVLNNQSNFVRFRFNFLSNNFTNDDGVSIDDFSIVLPAAQEAAADEATAPSSGCGLGNEIVKFKIINMGLTPISSFTASYKKDAVTPAVNEPVTLATPLAPGDTLLYSFATPVNLSTVGVNTTFNLKIWVSLTNDPNHGDDTTFRLVNSLFVPNSPAVTNASIAYGTLTTLTATSTLPVTWYSAVTGGTLLQTGATYTTSLLYGDTVYYAQVVTPDGCYSPRAPDTVFVSSPPPFDGAVLTVDDPQTGFNLQLPPVEHVSITLRNYGTQPISNFTLKYRITGPVNSGVQTAIYSGTVQYGDIATFTFTPDADLSVFGTYTIKSWIEVSGDLNHINDTATATVINKMFVYCPSASTDGAPVDDNIGNVTISNMNNGVATPAVGNATAVNNYTNFTNLPPIQMTKDQTYQFSVSAIYGNASAYNTVTKVFVDWNWNGEFEEASETAATISISNAGPDYTGTASIYVPTTAHTGLTRFRVVMVETTVPTSVDPCGTYTYGETEDYTALISPQLDKDLGVNDVIMPYNIYPENISSPVIVSVRNYGLLGQSPFFVSYKIDNNPTVTETYSGPDLPGGQDMDYTFASPVVLTGGHHTICAWATTIPVADSNAFNDTTCKALYGIPINNLPYVDDFEDTLNVKFTTEPATGTNWIYGVPTTTFPGNAHSPTHVWGTNLNMASGYNVSANCNLTTQLFTFNNAVNAKVSFWMKRQVQTGDGAVLEYSIDNGNSWQVLGTGPTPPDPNGINWYNGTITGSPCWTGNANNWIKLTYKLSMFNPPFVGNVRFRFRFVSNTFTNAAGVFIDDFQIFKPYMTDAGIDSIYTPHHPDAAGYAGHVKVRLNNFSSSTITSCPISYKIGNAPPVTETWTGVLAPGDTIPFTFSTTYGIPQGQYCIKAYTTYPQDSAYINDTSYKCAFGIPVFSIPYQDCFDSVSNYFYTTGPQWERGTPTGTMINAPFTPANCWKTKINTYYSAVGTPDLLYSPMFDLTYGYDSITFYHISDTYQGDKSWVEYLAINSSGEKIWKRLGIMGDPNGYNWYNSGSSGFINNGGIPGWHRSAYDLKVLFDIANPAQFRFNFFCYYPNTSTPPRAGWAVDCFELTTPKIPQDAGVVEIVQPLASVTYGTQLMVKVKIKNFGTDTLTSIPVRYQINGTTVAAGNWSGSLSPDATVDYEFPWIDSPLQTFDLCAFTDLSFDTKLDNDTTCKLVSVVAPALDVAVTQIIEPVTQTIHGNEAKVKIRVTNLGYTPVSSIPLEYRVGDTVIVVNQTWSGTALNQNEFIDFTFDQGYSYEYLGWYYLCALTKMDGDGYVANDTICAKIEEKWTFIPENPESGLFMAQNYPNPSDESTEIEYRVPGAGQVTFSLVNFLGQRLLTKAEKVTQGDHKFIIDTSKLPQGLYYYYIEYDGKRMIRKMVVAH